MVLDLGGNSNRKVEGMMCPHCRVALAMSAREGIEIDYCPKCRGVWLDRGELDKIIERSITESPQPAQKPARDRAARDYDDDDRYDRRKPYKKRKSWIAEIFDELT